MQVPIRETCTLKTAGFAPFTNHAFRQSRVRSCYIGCQLCNKRTIRLSPAPGSCVGVSSGSRASFMYKSLITLQGGDSDDIQRGSGLNELLVPEETRLKPPPLYRVILLNDDYTPMEFVVDVLRIFFGMDIERATRVMLKVHTEGKGVCGVYPREIAETKAVQVNEHARAAEHPLLCDIEADD